LAVRSDVRGNFLWNPASSAWEAKRTATVYKNITTLANGSTALWTAGVGKRWRILGCQITLMQGTTAAAACVVKLLDVAADTGIGVTLGVGALTAAPATIVVLDLKDMGNGITAAATNTALNVNLSSVLAVGGVTVEVWGVEE
jgi:hypothetical protein